MLNLFHQFEIACEGEDMRTAISGVGSLRAHQSKGPQLRFDDSWRENNIEALRSAINE